MLGLVTGVGVPVYRVCGWGTEYQPYTTYPLAVIVAVVGSCGTNECLVEALGWIWLVFGVDVLWYRCQVNDGFLSVFFVFFFWVCG